jgi:5-methyltetrahydrofolate--homocysteine methyltransferase
VTGEEASLEEILPLVKEYGLPVIALTLDEKGIPAEASARLEIAHKIIERAEALGIPREDIIIDTLTLSLGANVKAGLSTLEATRRVRDELGVNQTQGCSNISHGLPNRPVLTGAYLAMAIEAGLTCPTVDVALVRLAVLSADLVLGRDNYAMRFISAFREQQKAAGE